MNKNNTTSTSAKTRDQIQEEYIEWDLNQMTEEDLRDFFIVTQNRELNDLDDDELVIEVKQFAPQLIENITLSISWIMNTTSASATNDNIIDRDELQQNLIDRILDDMDLQTLMQLVADQLDNSYDSYTVDELITEVKEYYPDLLE